MLRSITILGSSSGRNAGDAALLSGIMDGVDSACGRRLLYEIPTYRPDFVYNTYHNRVRPVSMLPWSMTAGMLGVPTFQSLLRSDMTIIYDAMLFDRELFNPLRNYMSSAYLMLPFAKKKGKIIGLYNAGTGPVNTPLGQKMLREIAEMADFITVRDEDSLNLLREIGVKNEHTLVTADAALTVSPAPAARVDQILTELRLNRKQEILAINVNSYLNSWAGSSTRTLTKEQFAETYAKAVTKVVEQLGVPLLFVATQHSDLEITRAVMGRIPAKYTKALLSNVTYSHFEIKGVLGAVSLLFAMRLHASILCTSAGTPAGALVFQKKVASYYKVLGIPENTLSFDTFSEETIASHILSCWQRREVTKKHLLNRIPVLQEKALLASLLLAMIDRGEAPAAAIAKLRERPATMIEASA